MPQSWLRFFFKARMSIRLHRIKVEPNEHGRRLDALLVSRYPRLNRSGWQERIRKGQVLIAMRPVRAGRRVRSGEQIVFRFEAGPEPEVDENYAVILEDDDLLVLLKPGNLPVHPSGTYRANTLYSLLQRDRGTDFPVHFAHRLDRETSGLLVLGKHPAAARALARSFATGKVSKEYLALVEGKPARRIDATGFIERDPTSPVFRKRRFVRTPTANTTACRTEFFRLASWLAPAPGPTSDQEPPSKDPDQKDPRKPTPISLLLARLHTGRLHQIRATLCSLGYPLVGDRLYGVDDTMYIRLINDEQTQADHQKLRLTRTALHCYRMAFPHPTTGTLVKLKAPMPDEFRTLRP